MKHGELKPLERQKIGVYGGTFNPPHLGHTTSAKLAMEALGLTQLLFVPAAIPPHKNLPEGTPTAAHRLEMVRIAADCLQMGDRVQASSLELGRAGKSYSVDTLEELHRENPDAELWFLMGEDMFLSLEDWHASEKIMQLAGSAAFARSSTCDLSAMIEQARQIKQKYHAQVQVLKLPQVVEISSTELRGLLAQGKGREYLLPAVYGYILRSGLYDTRADLKNLDDADLRACSYSMVKARRISHIKGTEEEAVRLASRWGADVDKARRAGILHDCTKYFSLGEQLQLCAEYSIVLDDLEQKAVKLLHSKTGACVARAVYGAPDDIYQAIYWHTTGKADMTMLEKIIYLADYMEPTRDFPGVERLRELAYQDLDAAVLLGCEMSVEEMSEQNLPIHPKTLEARDWLRMSIHTSSGN